MSRFLFIILSSLLFIVSAHAQTLYMPRNVKQAFDKGTRSPDGKPGKHYWQNKGIYDITVTAHPPDRNITGSETITYFNNSPDTLRNIVIKLFLNIHKPGAVRYQNADADYLTDGVHIDGLTVNGQKQTYRNNAQSNTWQYIRLPETLMPKDSVHLSFKWHYQISLQSNREGMIDSTTYFLAYFYPRVAVYDDYSGWDMMDFTDQQEFYNDFNDYTLEVQVPKNYIVWSTGTLLNPGEVLQPEYASRLQASMKSDSVYTIANTSELAKGLVTIQHNMNTWRWKADDITDVALAISNHFVWDASSVVVDDRDSRRASVQAAYNDTAADFHHVVEYGRHALDWLSHHWPGIPYPYPKTTIVQGYADMEYPMMVNDGTQSDFNFTRFVEEHEIAHTYFPFYMGINETRYAFMDEGWATTFELLIGREDLGKERADAFFRRFRVNGWIHDPSAVQDLPIITPANVLRNQAYGNNAYGKPALGYLAVKDLLGDDLFKKCLHEYMEHWNGKHPIPWDFFNSFNSTSGKNLNWFWSNWFFSNHYLDLAIQKADKTSSGYSAMIENIGGMASPFDLMVTYTDGTEDTFHYSPGVWKENQKNAKLDIKTKKKIKLLELEGGIYVDADPSNNTWSSK